MELLIIGAGAMGGLFGALLAPHAAVSLLTTNQEHAAVMGGHGLTLVDLDGATRRVPVRVLTDPQDYGRRADVVLVCTKTRATAQAAATARDLLAADGLALTLQNGLGNLEQLVAAVGAQRAAAGVTSQAATLLAPGRVRHAGSGVTHLGFIRPPHGAMEPLLAATAAVFAAGGLTVHTSDLVLGRIWAKLFVNVGINALTATLGCKNGELLTLPGVAERMARLVAEAMEVARAEGIAFVDDPQEATRIVCQRTAENVSSMLQDVRQRRRTEIDAINGAIVAGGQAHGIATPENELLCQQVREVEMSYDCAR